jgi:hypothetical protein
MIGCEMGEKEKERRCETDPKATTRPPCSVTAERLQPGQMRSSRSTGVSGAFIVASIKEGDGLLSGRS